MSTQVLRQANTTKAYIYAVLSFLLGALIGLGPIGVGIWFATNGEWLAAVIAPILIYLAIGFFTAFWPILAIFWFIQGWREFGFLGGLVVTILSVLLVFIVTSGPDWLMYLANKSAAKALKLDERYRALDEFPEREVASSASLGVTGSPTASESPTRQQEPPAFGAVQPARQVSRARKWLRFLGYLLAYILATFAIATFGYAAFPDTDDTTIRGLVLLMALPFFGWLMPKTGRPWWATFGLLIPILNAYLFFGTFWRLAGRATGAKMVTYPDASVRSLAGGQLEGSSGEGKSVRLADTGGVPRMKSRNPLILATLAVALILAVGIFFWPTLYRYEHVGQRLVRIHRVTGETAVLVGDTWRTREQPRKAQAIPWEVKLKVTGNAGLTGYGSFSGKLYNGSDWTIARATFRVVAKDPGGKVRWDRRFADDIHLAPLSTSSFYIPVTGDENVAKTEWYIEELKGYPPK